MAIGTARIVAVTPAQGPAKTVATKTAGKKLMNGTPWLAIGESAKRSKIASTVQRTAIACPFQKPGDRSNNSLIQRGVAGRCARGTMDD